MKNIKKLSALFLALVLLVSLAACGSAPSGTTSGQAASTTAVPETTEAAQTEAAATAKAPDSSSGSGKVLVAYFSATGTTKGVAEQIAALTQADTYEILAAQPYTDDDLNWNDANSRTTKEQNDKAVRPEIAGDLPSLDGYTTVFVGYPIWWGEEPRIMDTFAESCNFDGKTVIPFCTSGGSGIGASGINLAGNAGSGNWLEGARLSSSSDTQGWIDGLNLPE